MRKRRGLRAFLGLLSCLLALALTATPALAQTYSGRAYAVGLSGVKLLGGTVTVPDTLVGDTGPLPAGGGSVSFGPGTVSLPGGLGSVDITSETAQGSANVSSANSNVAGLSINVSEVSVLSATLLVAQASVGCSGPGPFTTSVGSLTIAGIDVTVNPSPNSSVTVTDPLSGQVIATVTFNQQTYTSSGNLASANSLVVSFPANGALAAVIQGTITVSHAEADLTNCASPTPTPSPTATPTPSPSTPGFPRTGEHGAGSTSGLPWLVVVLAALSSAGGVGLAGLAGALAWGRHHR